MRKRLKEQMRPYLYNWIVIWDLGLSNMKESFDKGTRYLMTDCIILSSQAIFKRRLRKLSMSLFRREIAEEHEQWHRLWFQAGRQAGRATTCWIELRTKLRLPKHARSNALNIDVTSGNTTSWGPLRLTLLRNFAWDHDKKLCNSSCFRFHRSQCFRH